MGYRGELLLGILFLLIGTVMGAAPQGGGGGGGSGGRSDALTPSDIKNINYSKWCMVSIAGVVGATLAYKIAYALQAKLRLLLCLGNEKQQYWATPKSDIFPVVKREILWAPLFAKRHNREFRISRAINVGTLPTRFQGLFLIAFLGVNFAFCTLSIDWSQSRSNVLREIRSRTGVMAVINMVPLFILAGRNNPLIGLLKISFDSYNLIHRWLGRIVVLESLAHVVAYTINKVDITGWASVGVTIKTSYSLQMGFISIVACAILGLHSPSILRHAFYETFLTAHILLVGMMVGTLWYHLALSGEAWFVYLKATIGVWAADRFLRLIWIIYRNVSTKMARATVEALAGDAVRVTVTMPRPWKFRPGQHAYLYMPSIGLWTSHPFTVAWSESKDVIKFGDKELSLHRQDIMTKEKPTMSFIIRRRTGFTDSLYRKAMNSPDKLFSTTVFAEGPYGVSHSLDSYGTCVLIAGGVGITHQVPYIQHLVQGYRDGTVAARRVTLVWIIQSPEHLEWIRPWMTSILAMEKRREVLKIMLFVTKPKSTKEIRSPSSTVQMFPGKPNIGTLLDMEIENKAGTMAVTVCGSGSLSDDVRAFVRSRTHKANIDFIEEAFSW
ncbi:ferric reductase like transmembrane component-domain-containing protein [Kalaharituber pfeilii]|nr:ferric reductase like transmembrane component-domain-containing protein [Kalaharituber pfeilii]